MVSILLCLYKKSELNYSSDFIHGGLAPGTG